MRCTYTNENVTFERHCCWNYEGWHFKRNAWCNDFFIIMGVSNYDAANMLVKVSRYRLAKHLC